ncbi:MAG: hypothetical protein H0X64_08935 [Gemmatimonadaceae bacterium]|nr:hypothetical protein [Gemmatimonadaceae bacterium]
MIGMVRKFGAAIVDGAEGMSPEAVIAHYEALSDADWAAEHGCDHHDALGHCLGHERADGEPAA